MKSFGVLQRSGAAFLAVLAVGVAILISCSSGSGTGEQAGQACSSPTQCYPGVDQTTLKGAVQCLTQVQGGYCTHLCQSDSDCCAVVGECRTGIRQVCAPFESTGQNMCFLSCETSDVGTMDSTVYCQQNADPYFGCRSTGGGAANRKVCVP